MDICALYLICDLIIRMESLTNSYITGLERLLQRKPTELGLKAKPHIMFKGSLSLLNFFLLDSSCTVPCYTQ